MSRTRDFGSVFVTLRREFTANTKRTFLSDIEGQIEDDHEIQEILETPNRKNRLLAVSCDRKYNDEKFSYHYFDILLVSIDSISGGNGIYKPANQLRVLQWNGKKSQLLTVLKYFGKLNRQINFKRALILPYPTPPTGYRLDTAIHKK